MDLSAPVQDFQHLAQPAWARSAPAAALQPAVETVSRSQAARFQAQADVEQEKEFVQAWRDWEQNKVSICGECFGRSFCFSIY